MDYYFRGKKVLAVLKTSSAYSQQHRQEVAFSHLKLDGDDEVFLWCSLDHESLTTTVPRCYRKHINQQLLEDINS